MNRRGWGEYRLGIAVTLLVFIVIFVTVIAGSERGPLMPDRVPYFVELDDAAGIRVGSFVRVAGIPAGEVEDLEIVPPPEAAPAAPFDSLPLPAAFETPADIRIELAIEERFMPFITPSSRAQLANLGLGGERYVKISAGDVRDEPLEIGATIETVPSVDWDLIIAKAARALNEVQIIAANVEEIRAKVEAGGGTAGRLLEADAPLYANLREVAARTEAVIDLIDNGPGIIGRTRADSALLRQVEAIRANAAAIDSLRGGPDGGAARWADPVELEAALAGLSTEIEALQADLAAGRGTAGRLMNDGELQRQLSVLQARVSELARAARENPLDFINIEIF